MDGVLADTKPWNDWGWFIHGCLLMIILSVRGHPVGTDPRFQTKMSMIDDFTLAWMVRRLKLVAFRISKVFRIIR